MDQIAAVQSPKSVADVEQLVKQLYRPGQRISIAEVNRQLQQLQLSADGWRMADTLMASEDENVRFFAALTFQVKLNNDGSKLDVETAETVQRRLIDWLVELVQKGDSRLVLSKLCSTLTTYYAQSPTLWKSPLLHLALSLHAGKAFAQDEMDGRPTDLVTLLPILNAQQIRILLWFSKSIAEDLTRVDNNDPKRLSIHSQMELLVIDASHLMEIPFEQGQDSHLSKTRADALQCFEGWALYAQSAWLRNPEAVQHLQRVLSSVFCSFTDSAVSLREDAILTFRDLLESYTSLFLPQHMLQLSNIIRDTIGPDLLGRISQSNHDMEDVAAAAAFVTAFGCADIQQIVENSIDEKPLDMITHLHLAMLSTESYPGDDDALSGQCLEFWNTYVEHAIDTSSSGSGADEATPQWLPRVKQVMRQVIELLWKKLWIPPHDVSKDWTDDESNLFKEFRSDSTDLMLSMYLLLAREMLQHLVDLTLHSLEANEWRAVEAALLCLDNLADNVLEDPSNEEVVGEIFRSRLFRDITDFSRVIPSQVRRTAIDMLASYGHYLERHPEFLPDTVRFLFAALTMPGLANIAAKSIESLCSICRVNMTDALPDFMAQYELFLQSETCEVYTQEKVIGAIAAIVQAVRPESAKAQRLATLLGYIENDIRSTNQYSAGNDAEASERAGVAALKCLASIGKNMQVPDDIPISIYDGDETPAGAASYWEMPEGQAIQRRIAQCFDVLNVVGSSSDAIEAACQVLRSGFPETEPGPFVLPASFTTSFLGQCSNDTPQLEIVLSTTSMLITHHSRTGSKRIDEEIHKIYDSVHYFIEGLGGPREDPTVSMSCIDVLSRMMPTYASMLFSRMDERVLNFTITSVEGPDPFPKRSACEFWSKLIKPQQGPVTDEAKQRYHEILAVFGPRLAQSLLHQFGGGAQRSELDYLIEPLKALLMNQRDALPWIQQTLALAPFSGTVDEKSSEVFVRGLAAARSDGGKLKALVRQFWAACRGTVISFGS